MLLHHTKTLFLPFQLQWIYCHSISPLQYHQRLRSHRLSRGLWWETPPTSPALSPEASLWATTPTDGCTTTPSLSMKLATCWLSVSWQNLVLVSTAVRWPTLLTWLGVTLLPLSWEVSIGSLYCIAPTFHITTNWHAFVDYYNYRPTFQKIL